jgi:hypothetical protein
MGRLSRELLGGGEPAPAPAPKPVVKAAPKEVKSGGMKTVDSEALGSEDE